MPSRAASAWKRPVRARSFTPGRISVFIAQNEPELLVVESVLKQGGIPYLAKGEQIQDLFGFGQMVVVNPVTGPVEVQVRMDDAATARELLAASLE